MNSSDSDLLTALDSLFSSYMIPGQDVSTQLIDVVDAESINSMTLLSLITAVTEESHRNSQRLDIYDMARTFEDVNTLQVLFNHVGGKWKNVTSRTKSLKQTFTHTYTAPVGNFIMPQSKIIIDPEVFSAFRPGRFAIAGVRYDSRVSFATLGNDALFPSGARGKLHVSFRYDFSLNQTLTRIDFQPRTGSRFLTNHDLAAFSTLEVYTADATAVNEARRRNPMDDVINAINGVVGNNSIGDEIGGSFGLRGIASYASSLLSIIGGDGTGSTLLDTVMHGARDYFLVSSVGSAASTAVSWISSSFSSVSSFALPFVEEYAIPIISSIGLALL
jgi:hypothetical protein